MFLFSRNRDTGRRAAVDPSSAAAVDSYYSSDYSSSSSSSSPAYPSYRRRHTSAQSPQIRLDLAIILLIIFFSMGLYVPSWVGMDGDHHLHTALFQGKNAQNDVDLPALQEKISQLLERLAAAEAETRTVFKENQRLRLDNKVEQSNLKSLTKAKNEEIRRLNKELEHQKKIIDGEAGGDAKMEKKIEELKREVRALKEKAARLLVQAAQAARQKAAESKNEHEAAHKADKSNNIRFKDEEDEEGEALPAKMIKAWEKAQEKARAAADAKAHQQAEAEDEDQHAHVDAAPRVNKNHDKASSFMTRALIPVPEPEPLSDHWEERIRTLFDLVGFFFPFSSGSFMFTNFACRRILQLIFYVLTYM